MSAASLISKTALSLPLTQFSFAGCRSQLRVRSGSRAYSTEQSPRVSSLWTHIAAGVGGGVVVFGSGTTIFILNSFKEFC